MARIGNSRCEQQGAYCLHKGDHTIYTTSHRTACLSVPFLKISTAIPLTYIYIFFFFFLLCCLACRILILHPRIKLMPLQWKQGVLTNRSPGKSLFFGYYNAMVGLP